MTRKDSVTREEGVQQVLANDERHFASFPELVSSSLSSDEVADDSQQILCNLYLKLQQKDDAIEDLKLQLGESIRERELKIQSLLIEHQAELSHVYSSMSWRVTTPVRFAGHLLRGDWDNVRRSLRKARGTLVGIGSRLVRPLRAAKYAVDHYGSLGLAVSKTIELYRKHGVSGLRTRAVALLLRNGHGAGMDAMSSAASDFYDRESKPVDDYRPLVTVIVPNYNHGRYLRERLDSIYAQTYSNIEVILLDDCSGDDSRAILSEYATRYASTTRCIFNETNSGGVFKQWKKGLGLADGELVWIAESDDYCSPNFVEENVRHFANEAVMLSFVRSVFVSGKSGKLTWSLEEYLPFMGPSFWHLPFVKSAHWLVNNCWSLKNIVPNVSSAMFRNSRDMPLMDDQAWSSMRVCGDWVFYLHLIRGGLVSYTPSATNYYRQHDSNTSTTSQSTDLYYREYEYVATQMVALYDLAPLMLERLEDDLRQQWSRCRPDQPADGLDALFNIERIMSHSSLRKPNLLIIAYALAAGGGETFPLMLANLMKEHGYGVTVLNCHEQPTEPGVRAMLHRDIPLLRLKELEHAPWVFKDLGVEVIHSHHAWVDITFASLLLGQGGPRHVVSMHGMYEMMPEAQMKSILPLMERGFDRIVYTAEKNLRPFSSDFIAAKHFTRVDNALPLTPIGQISRAELDIDEADFVLCLVSRAIPEKGWAEAVAAVQAAQGRSKRRIHLVLIGEGPQYDMLKDAPAIEGVHLLGFKKNIRDYFALADVGLLPSRFKGESYPLVLIDCLHAGTPLLASDIGEIRSMLLTDDGMAGTLFELSEWEISVDKLADLVVELAAPESGLLRNIRSQVPAAARKFDPEQLFKNYDIVYREALSLTQKSGAKGIFK